MSRLRLLVIAALWSGVMIYLGASATVVWPGRVPGWEPIGDVLGSVMVACGLFVFAAAAARVFPRASPRVTAACELLPWLGAGLWVAVRLME